MAYHRNQQLMLQNDRRYHVYVPDNPVAAQLPAILVFHGGGQDVEVIAKRWGIDLNPGAPNPPVPAEVADYILVFPEADPHLGDEWIHVGARSSGFPDHDVRFVADLLTELTTTPLSTPSGTDVTANPELIYAAGFSNGGGMVWQLAYSSLLSSFRGFAAVGKVLDPEKVSRYPGVAPAVPVIYIQGTADLGYRPPALQIEASLGTTLPAFTVREMLQRNGIAPNTPANTQLVAGSTNLTEVVGQVFVGTEAFGCVTIINGGHNWPTPLTSANPPVASHFNATRAIVEFWRTHAGLP